MNLQLRFTIKIQNKLFFIASFNGGMNIIKELVVGRSLQKALRLCHQAPLFLRVIQIGRYRKNGYFQTPSHSCHHLSLVYLMSFPLMSPSK